jgi:hypothetical protein
LHCEAEQQEKEKALFSPLAILKKVPDLLRKFN